MALVLVLLALQVVLGGVTVLLSQRRLDGCRPLRRRSDARRVDHPRCCAARLPASRTGTARPLRAADRLVRGAELRAAARRLDRGQHRLPHLVRSGFPLCNGSLVPSVDHHVVINLAHRTWAGAMLVLALWVMFRSRRDRAGRATDRVGGNGREHPLPRSGRCRHRRPRSWREYRRGGAALFDRIAHLGGTERRGR